jgi:RNA polymerase sigma-70 factor (ECF subfamily)
MDTNLAFQKVIQEGDYKAFEAIFHHFYSPLCVFAVKMVESPEIAAEIVSDVFFKVWKNRQSIQLSHALSSYLFGAVKNQCIDYLRIKTPHFKEVTSSLNLSQSDNPEQLLIQEELSQKIDNEINNLPEQCKIIFRLSRDRGLKYQEIADLLHISVKTVETQMGRALKYLRTALKDAMLLPLILFNLLFF